MSVRRACAALGAVSLLLIVCLALLLKERQQPEPAQEILLPVQQTMITDVSVGSLAAVAWSSGGESMVLAVSGDQVILLDAPQGAAISDQMLKAFLYRMAHMPAERTLGTISDPQEYGFSDYAAAVALLGADGSRTRLYLGSQVPFESLWYLMREGDDTLYLVDEMTAQMMRYTADDFRQLDIFPKISAGDLAAIERVALSCGDQSFDIYGLKQDGAVYFYMVSPFDSLLSWERVAKQLVAPLAALDKAAYVSGDVSPAKYGLYGPDAVRLTTVVSGEERTLLFAPADDGHYYCARKGANDVVLVRREDAAFVGLAPMDLMDSTLYTRGAADVDRVQVYAGAVSGVLNISGSGMMLRGEIAGRTLSQAQTVDLYKKLTMLPPAQALDPDQAIGGEAVLELVFDLKDGSSDTVALFPAGERRCAVMINGEAAFTTYSATVDEIIRVCAQAFGK